MKAFFVGLLFLIAVAVLTGIGFLLLPFILVMYWLLQLLVVPILVIFAVWLLGRFILFVWERMR